MSVVAAEGFEAAGVAAGIKADALDVAVVVANAPAAAAAVFTRNRAAAPPVLVSKGHLAASRGIRAIVANSGCANAATGDEGTKNARLMAETVAARLGTDPEEVLVCSTGTIGPQLPMPRLVGGIERALATRSRTGGTDAATAIMTTDSVPKEAVVHGGGWTVGGMAKGAGMVRPDMATMLAFITTDAVVAPEDLDRALRVAVDGTFNSLNIDGCESTNDSAILLASGASDVEPSAVEFTDALTAVCRDLALRMARDAEGASRVVAIDVAGATDDAAARRLGRTAADSALVRSSFYGGDVNWGRILAALGTCDEPLDPDRITIAYQGVTVFAGGVGATYDEEALLADCAAGDLAVAIGVGDGPGTAHIVTTDLTPEYVVFNGERS